MAIAYQRLWMIGETVGSYLVRSKLGEGGMGVVYIAEHPLLRKKAVVKFLHAELSSDAEIVERFFNEARSATMIRHPGIVDVFDFGHHASGCAFILMEFLDGESLADRLRKGPLDAAVAIMIGRQIASALGAAHEQGIIHRDLKPDNIFLVLDREAAGSARIKVLDFGIAKLAGETAGAVKTQTGAVMGTPSYMAPEQCRSAGDVDHRTDIYALGCILFELVCGRPPFRAHSLGQLIAAHMFEPPPAPTSIVRSIPADLETVILRALAKEASDRQASMAELSAELSACDAAPTGTAPAVWTSPPIARATGLEPTMASGVGLAGAAVSASTTLGESSGQLAMTPVAASHMRPAGKRRRWWIGTVVATTLVGGGVVFWQCGTTSVSLEDPVVVPIAKADIAVSAPNPTPPDATVLPNVTLVIDSEPQGADVIQEHDGIRVGHTPYKRSLSPVANGTLVYVLKLKGYEDTRVELAADRDGDQKLALKPLAQTSTGKKPPHKAPRTTEPPPKEEPRVPTGPASDGMLRPKP